MNYLIDIPSIKRLSFIHTNVEDEVIRKVLTRAQDMYIEPILGSALYNRLLEGVENNNLTANELKLVNTYISQVLSIAVELKCADTITTEIRNIGVGVATEQNYRANTPNEMERTKDLSYQDLTFYRNRLRRFLCENERDYPLYSDTNQYGIKPEGRQTSYSKNYVVIGRSKARKPDYLDRQSEY